MQSVDIFVSFPNVFDSRKVGKMTKTFVYVLFICKWNAITYYIFVECCVNIVAIQQQSLAYAMQYLALFYIVWYIDVNER